MKSTSHKPSIGEKIVTAFVLTSVVFASSPLAFLASYSAGTPVAEAAFNQQINYQGKLTDSSGNAVSNGTYHMMFRLYTSATAATTTYLWEENRSTATGDRITVTNGLFSVMLGSSTALTSVNFNQTLYLGVEVGGGSGSPTWDGEMSPRKILGAVPAAFQAKQLDGLNNSQFLRSDATNATTSVSTFVTISQTGAGGALTVTGTTTLSNLILTGSTTLQNFTAINATTTNATTTSLFATIASSTNLFATLGNIGTLTAGTINGQIISSASNFTGSVAVGTTLVVTGATTLSNLLLTGSTTLQNFTFANATGTQLRIGDGTVSIPSLSFANDIDTGLYSSAANRLSIAAGGSQIVEFLFSGQRTVFSGNANFQNGTAASPSINNFSSETTGIFFPSITALGFSTNASERLRIDASGNVGIGTTSPWRKFSVNGSSDLGTNALAGYFTATTSVASVFPYASTTAITASGTGYFGNLYTTASSTFANIIFANATGTNATTTSLFATTLRADTLALTNGLGVSAGGTGATTFGQGWIFSAGGTTALSASTSPTVNYITATSTTATSTFAGGITGPGSFTVQSSSGYVGVGTAAPLALLDVNGVSAASLGTVSAPGFAFRTDLNTGIWSAGADTIDFTGGGINLVRMTGNGIRTMLAGSASSPSMGFVDANLGFFQAASDTLGVTTNGIERMRWTSSGNIGIGTTSPWRNFSVNGSSDLGTNALAGYFTATTSTASIFPYASTTAITASGTGYFGNIYTTASSTFANIIFANATGTNATTTNFFSTTASSTNFFAGTATLNTASVTGSATIGTTLGVTGATTLSSTLAVTGATTLSNTLTATGGLTTLSNLIANASSTIGGGTQATGLTISGGATTTGFLVVQGTGTSTFAGRVSVAGQGLFSSGSIAAPGISFSGTPSSGLYKLASGGVGLVANGVEYLYAGSAANVLEVGTASTMFRLANGSLAAPSLQFSSANAGLYSPTGADVAVSVNSSTELLRANTTGLGIGTTTPNWKLQVAATRPSIALSDTSAAANNKHWTLSSQGGNFYFATSSDALATSTIAALTINSNGYLGIGTTTPGSILSVQGVGNFTSATSTFSSTGGVNLTAGCFAVNGTCVGGSGGGVSLSVANTWTALQTFGNIYVTASSTFANIIFANATGTNATTTNFFATTASSTNLFAGTATLNTASVTGSATIGTTLGVTGATTLSSTLAVTGATTLSNTLTATGGLTTLSNLLLTGSTTLQNFTAINSTSTNATSTTFFATNLRADTLALTNGLGVSAGGTGATTFGQGWIFSAGGTTALSASTSPTVNYITATSTTATSTFAGGLSVGAGALEYDFSSGITSIDALSIGATSFDTNAGVISWTDLPVTADSAAGTPHSYSAQIDNNPILTVYGESDGAGGAQNLRVGIGTTSPYAALSVVGEVVASYFTATSTTATSTFAGHISTTNASFGGQLSITGTGTSTFAKGIDIAGGCFSVAGTCIGAGGGSGVTSVATDSTLTGGPITATGTLGLNLSNANTWTTLQTFGNIYVTASSTFANIIFANATGTNATTTNFFSTTASSTNLFAAVFKAGTNTLGTLLLTGSTTLQNFTAINSTSTNATSTSLFATNLRGTTAILTNLNLTGSTTLQDFTAINATTTNATTTALRASGPVNFGGTLTATGGLTTLSNLFVTGSSTLANLIFANATGTNATTTNFFSTTASSTNLFAQTITGGLYNGQTIGSATNFTGTLTATGGLSTLSNLLLTGSTTLQNFTFVNATGTQLRIGDGTVSIPSLSFANDIDTGLYSAAANDIRVTVGGTDVARFIASGQRTIFSGNANFQNGTAASPSINNYSSETTGIFFPSTTSLGFSTNALERLRIDASGNVGIGTTSPWRTLSVKGSSDLGTNALAGYFTATTSVASIFPYASTTAITSSGSAYFATTGGNVGIGTTSPSQVLSVTGNAYITATTTANVFEALSTTASSTFANGINITKGCFAISGTCISGSGGGVSLSVANTWTALQTFGNIYVTASSTFANIIFANATGTNATTTNFFSTTASSTNLFTSMLGIASSSPSQALSVTGNAYISGTTTATVFNSTNGYKQGSNTILYTDTTNNRTLVGVGAGGTISGFDSDSTGVGYQSLYSNSGSHNTSVGSQAMYSNLGAVDSTAIGYQALYSNNSNYNTAVGSQALYLGTTGGANTALGYKALYSNNTDYNLGVGYETLYSNTSGQHNTAVGAWHALYANTTGSSNNAFGLSSLVSNTTGSFNTAMGRGSGAGITTGSNNTFLGHLAGFNDGTVFTANVSNSTAIGYFAQVTATSSLILGGTGAYAVNVGIGTTSPKWLLQIASSTKTTFALSDTGAAADKKHWTLTSQGGNFYFATSSDALATSTIAALTINSNGYVGIGSTTPSQALSVTGNAYVSGTTTAMVFDTISTSTAYKIQGTTVLASDLLRSNFFAGPFAGSATMTGGANTAIGYQSLPSNTTGASSTIMGYRSGYSNTTGLGNVMFGVNSGYLNTTGNYNTMLGYQSGYSNTTGTEGVFVGTEAGSANTTGYSNIYMGSRAGYGNNVGSFNVAIGYQNGYLTTTGSENTLIGGFRSGFNLTGGSYNTFLGSQTDASTTNNRATSSIAIGYGARVTADNQLVIGSDNSYGSITDAYFGQGVATTSPAGITLNATGGWGTNNAGAPLIIAGGKATGNATGGSLIFKTSDIGSSGNTLQSLTERMRITSKGSIGISTTSPDARFTIVATSSASTIPLFTVYSALTPNSIISTTTAMVITHVGNVGIGLSTTSQGTPFPVNKLQVNDASAGLTFPLKIENSAGDTTGSGAGILFTMGSSGGTNARGKGALTYTYDTAATWNRGDFNFLQNTAESDTNPTLADAVMTIRNNGDVGIGTTTPYAQFSVVSNVIASTTFALKPVASQTANIIDIYNTSGVLSSVFSASGYLGLGTTSPSQVLSVTGNAYITATTTANVFEALSTTASSTFANGINITKGCFSVNGSCVGGSGGGSGTVTSVAIATPNATLSLGGTNPITSSGTINVDLNLSNANTWTALQTFGNIYVTASSTFANIIFANATGTNATTTNFFSTTASSTNLFTSMLGIASSSPSQALSVTGNAYISGTTTATVFNSTNGYKQGSNTILDTTVSQNTYVGREVGLVNDGVDNTAVGYGAFRYPGSTGNYNTAVGSQALYSNSAGSSNSAMGYQALYSTSATGNVGTGFRSLYNNTSGVYNSATGFQSLFTNTTGNYNTASGYQSLYSNTIGSQNSAFGIWAGYNITSGSNNTFLGYGAGKSDGTISTLATVSNSTAIGYNAQVTATSSLILGGTGAYAVNVGIGTTSPKWLLQIASSTKTTFALSDTGAAANQKHWTLTSQGGNFYFATSSDALATSSISALTINSNGYLGIGSTTPSQNLSVTGNAYISATTTANIFNVLSNAGGYKQNSVTILTASTTGFNTAVGQDVLIAVTNGSLNTGTGYQVLKSLTSGTSNTANGYQSLNALTTGSLNTADGYQALKTLTTGTNNVAMGDWALRLLDTTSDNTAIGHWAAASTTGSRNTAVGSGALILNTNQSDNTAIGYWALASTTGSGSTAVGSGALQRSTSAGSVSAFGYQALNANTTGDGNTAMGYRALYSDTTGAANTAVGISTLQANTTGFGNVAIGRNSLYAATSSSYNIGIGYHAMYNYQPGVVTNGYNIAIGSQGLYSNTTGTSNTAIGTSALYTNTSGTSNNAIGDSAIDANTTGSYNNAYGSGSLGNNSTGNYNIAMGHSAGNSVTTGSRNILLGYYAGGNGPNAVTTGSNNIIIGYNLMATSATAYGSLNIGNLIFGEGLDGQNNTLSTGNIGIGTTSPYAKFSISNFNDGSSEPLFVIASSSGSTATATPFIVDRLGYVGLGTTTPSQVLSVLGNAYITATTTANVFEALSTTASSTFANGINITKGCFAVNGTCVGGGGGSSQWTTSGSDIYYSTGFVGIGTSSPYAALSVVGATGVVADIYTATSTTATSTFSGGLSVGSGALEYDFSSGITSIDALSIGATSFDTNAGVISWTDLPVTSDATAGTPESYSAQIDGSPILTIYGESNGVGGVQNLFVGIGTTSPYAALSVVGEVVASYFTATSTTATSTFAGFIDVNGTGDNATSTFASNLWVKGGLQIGTGSTHITNDGIKSGDGSFNINTTSATFADPVYFTGLSTDTTIGLAGALCLDGSGQLKQLVTTGTCIVSSGRFKHDIATTTSGIATVKQLRPVTFTYNGDTGGFGQQFGFIAEEVEQVDPRLVVHGSDGLPFSVRYENFTAVLAKSIQEIVGAVDITGASTSTASIKSLYAGTDMPAISIDSVGNIGIGTTSPAYKLQVMGDIAATSFVNISTREAKKDISYLSVIDGDNILLKIKSLNVATYRYNIEPNSNPLRLGLIAEEVPSEILAAGGKGVDVYKLSTFILAGVKAQQAQLESLDARVARLEASVGGASSGSIESYLSGVGVRLSAAVAQFKNVVVESLTVGSSAQPSGITLFDEVTKQPYCLKIANGNTVTSVGECRGQATDSASSGNSVSSGSGDSVSPVITLNGNNPANVVKGTSYLDLGATVSDNVNQNLGYQVTGDQIDTNVSGIYTVTFTAVDQAGNRATTTRSVIVSDSGNGVVQETATTTVSENTVLTTTGSTTTSETVEAGAVATPAVAETPVGASETVVEAPAPVAPEPVVSLEPILTP